MRVREHARSGDDLLLGNPRHLLDLVEGKLAGAFGQLVEAVGPALDEVVVVEVLVNDDLDHRKGERGVGAGAQLQMDVSVSSQPGDARLDGDELAAELHGVGDPMAHEEVRVGDGGVAAPNDGALRARPLGIVVAQRGELREVGDQHAAVGHDHERQAGEVARGAGEEAVLVRAAERVRHTADLPLVVASGAAQAVDGVAAVGHRDAAEFLVAGFKRFVPRDALPLVLATLASALHRVENAVGVELDLLESEAARAEGAAVVRIVRVAFALDEAAGLLVGVHEHAAALVAARCRPDGRTRDDHAVFLVLPLAGMLPARVNFLVHAGTEVELILLFGVANIVAVAPLDIGLDFLDSVSHRSSSRRA